MRFSYDGISYGPSVNKNQSYTGKELVELVVYTIKQLYHEKWDITLDEYNHIGKIDIDNIDLDDILYCQELCGAAVILPSKL